LEVQIKANKSKENSLGLLGFIFPNRDFSKRYGRKK
jgi:hypothetical protein